MAAPTPTQPPPEIPFRYYLLLTVGYPPLPPEQVDLKLAKWAAHMGSDVWESADAFAQDMSPLIDDWNKLAHRSELLTPLDCLKHAEAVFSHQVTASAPKKAPPPGKVGSFALLVLTLAQFEFTELDEMSLVYRFILRGEPFTHLAADYHLDETTVGLHIHNHVWAFALLWGCRYTYPLRCSDVTQMTPAKFKKLLPAGCFALAGDCTEMAIAAFYSTALSKLLFSSKNEFNTVKLWLGCTLSGWIALSSDLYGGGSSEVAPLHGIMRSAVFQQLMADAKELGMKLILFEDRGFRELCIPSEYAELIDHVIPPFLEKQPQFQSDEVVFARVWTSFA
jgi:hypothetical protein